MNSDTKKGVFLGILIAITALLAINSISIGYRVLIKKEINYETKAKTIYNLMQSEYVEDLDTEKIYEGLYTGMVALATDKYSRYISKEDFESYKISTSGNYAGIGAKTSVDPDDYLIYVVSAYENSPAAKAGLTAGDKIVKVNGTSVSYDNYADAIDMIRGKEGTSITLTIKIGRAHV